MLRQAEATHDQIVYVESLRAQSARFGQLREPLPSPLLGYLEHRGNQLWSHQAETIEAARDGHDVILTTGTASGKTLAFNLPVFERLLEDTSATALYLYPMKALANDQLATLQELDQAVALRLNPSTYDGDTSSAKRARIRAQSQVVLTNPWALHHLLPQHHLWESFFRNLSVVVVDEAHWYRGVLGSNVAFVLRRLRRIARSYGSDPQFILASATIGNPAEHGEALVGRPPVVVSDDGAPRGPKDFVFWNPLLYQDRSMHTQAADLLATFAGESRSVICFTASRRMAELLARWARDQAPSAAISSYRAGYLPTERRALESALREGRITGIATTTALELGIDVGSLEVALLAGYPGTICSTWQQAGRAGRTEAQSLAVLIAFEGPRDQYLLDHPDELFGRPHEQAVVDLTNANILKGHLLCAATEMPLQPDDSEFFGPAMDTAIDALADDGLLVKTAVGHVFHGTFRAVDQVSLTGIDSETFEIVCQGCMIETMSRRQAMTMAHPGAILLHLGESYRVNELDLEHKTAQVVAENTENYTEATVVREISIIESESSETKGRIQQVIGSVKVTEHIPSYKLMSREQVLGISPLDLPPLSFDTIALWLVLPAELGTEVKEMGLSYAGGLHAAEHALIHMMPLLSMCDRGDVGGVSMTMSPDLEAAAIFIYDGYPGGIGLARKAQAGLDRLVTIALDRLRECRCQSESGCPSCVYDRNCGNDNQPMDRLAAILVLEAILVTERQSNSA